MNNGKEYGIQKLQEWADQEGIDIEYVPPYTPNQASIAEATNWMLIIKARTMVINTGFPLELWPEIMRTTAYLYNYISSKSTLGDNNEELINPITSLFWELNTDYFNPLHHIKYHYFKIYKYRAFIHIPKDIKV